MRMCWTFSLALCLASLSLAGPAQANRLTFEVWPDASPDHVTSCTFALMDGWISLVQVTGVGMPGLRPVRWRASAGEIEALASGLQAFVGGDLASIDPTRARQPAAPFLSVTWMTRLDNRLATGLYIQPGLVLPGTLSESLGSLGLAHACGLSATADE